MPRKSNWKTSRTKAIRVPAHLADQLLSLARSIEDQQRFVQNDEPTDSAMVTLQRPGGEPERHIVSAPISTWQQAENITRELLATKLAHLSEGQRLEFAYRLAEAVFGAPK